MSKLANAGQVTLPSGTGGVVIDCGFAPKAVVVMIAGESSANQMSHSFGVIAGATQRCRAGVGATDNAFSNAALHLSDTAVGTVWPVTSATPITISGSISGNDLTLTPSASLGSSYDVTWWAIGGTSVEVAVRSTTFANGVTTTVNDCGFNPTCVLFGSGSNATLNTNTSNRGEVAFGAIVGTTRRAAGWGIAQASTANCAQTRWMTDRSVNGYAFSAWRSNTITVSLVTGGFSINNTDTQSGWTWALCIAGLNVALLSSTMATSAANVDLTGAGFTPTSALLFGTPDNTSTDTNQDTTTSGVWGVAVDGGAQASASVIFGLDTQRTGGHRASSTTGLVTMEKTGVNTYANKATATASFLSDGIRYAFSAGHSAAGHFGVLLTDGAPPVSGPSAAALARYRRHHLLMEP